MSGSEEEIEEQDERLDFFSPKFDPLLALTSVKLQPPIPHAKPFDNISKYFSTYHKKEQKPGPSKDPPQEEKLFERKFQPNQMPITYKPKRLTNVLSRMNKFKGPLQFFIKCKDEHLRIKILTRDFKGVRGYCEAFLVAFDKYWNLIIQDVTEIWTRRKKTKVPPNEIWEKPLKCDSSLYFPEVKIVKIDRKSITSQRHVDEMLIRGEHIVLVAILSQ